VSDLTHGIRPLGRLEFVTDAFLDLLRREARASAGDGRVGAPGKALKTLAVSRKLRDAVSGAFGVELVPSREALYQYDEPGAHVEEHLDGGEWDVVVHLLVEGPTSVVVARDPAVTRVELRTGDAVALRGRTTPHAWEPVGERRTLLAIGFADSLG